MLSENALSAKWNLNPCIRAYMRNLLSENKFRSFITRCLVNLYKLEVFKDAAKEPLNVQISNLLKVSVLISSFSFFIDSMLNFHSLVSRNNVPFNFRGDFQHFAISKNYPLKVVLRRGFLLLSCSLKNVHTLVVDFPSGK